MAKDVITLGGCEDNEGSAVDSGVEGSHVNAPADAADAATAADNVDAAIDSIAALLSPVITHDTPADLTTGQSITPRVGPVLRRAGVSPTGKEPAPPAPTTSSADTPAFTYQKVINTPVTDSCHIDNSVPFERLGTPFTQPQSNDPAIHNLHAAGSVPTPDDVLTRYKALGIDEANPAHPNYGNPPANKQ